uniref:RanBP-type and C3HC4-type zinc finger-containing protein 1 n=1 Tax=Culex pipiens TaxID=7175 RepID=A0A8D8GDE0_CULPI
MSRSSSKITEQQKKCPECQKVKPDFKCMVLINCKHMVCRSCLSTHLLYCGKSGYRCPVADCEKLMEEAEVRDIMEHTRPTYKLAPVANHWNWSSRREEKVLSRSEKEPEYSSYFPKEDFPKLPSSKASKDSGSNKYRNVMDEPVPRASGSYESFKSSRKEKFDENQNEMKTDVKDWDSTSRTRLRKLIAEKMHKSVDFVFVASEAELSLNMNSVECLICQDYMKTGEGFTFRYCSSYFCRTCLTQPKSFGNDVILLYKDSTNESQNCAVIINTEMKSFLQKLIDVPTNKVSSLVSIYENSDAEHFHGKKSADNTKKCTPSTSLDATLNKSAGRTSQLDSMSEAECEFCYHQIEAKRGVILRCCYHFLCKGCLIVTIMKTLETGVEVRCPMVLKNNRRCKTIIQEREIKSLLTANQYDVYERKCLEAAENAIGSSVHCLKPNCTGWIVIEGYKESFTCPVCSSVNCLSCKAIHRGKSCSTYQAEQGPKGDKDLSLKEKLMALDAQQKIRCPECMSDNLNPPNNNFIRCRDCRNVFSPPKPESKK